MAFIGNTNTTQAFTPAIDYFSGNASTTAFTLSRPVASVAQVQVVVNNVAQNPSSAYTISSSTITFTSAPTSGTNNIYVYYTSPITQVIAPGQGTVTSDSFGTITNFTTTGNTTLGDATSDTLTVGVTGIVKDASGNVGIGTASPSTKFHVYTSVAGNTPQTNAGTTALIENVSVTGSAGLKLRSGASAYPNYFTYDVNSGSTATMVFYDQAAGAERMRIDSSGNLLFSSGYGSVATAYGCRAWVNFNGTGTVAIRASGNVSSITDNGTGDYTVNFTTAMPDANYASASIGYHVTGVTEGPVDVYYTVPQTTTSIRLQFRGNTGGDAQLVNYLAIR